MAQYELITLTFNENVATVTSEFSFVLTQIKMHILFIFHLTYLIHLLVKTISNFTIKIIIIPTLLNSITTH
jgi:hypothetical protein